MRTSAYANASSEMQPDAAPGLQVKNTLLNLSSIVSQAKDASAARQPKSSSSSRRRSTSEPAAKERTGDDSVSTSEPEESEDSFPGTPEASPRGMPEKIVCPMPSVFNAMDCLTKMMNCVNAGAADDLCDLAVLRFPEDIIYLVSTPDGTDELRGHDQVCAMLRHWLKAFPDLHITLEDLTHPKSVGEAVKWRATCVGTQHEPIFMSTLPVGSLSKFTLNATVYKNSAGQTTWIHWEFEVVESTPKAALKQPSVLPELAQPMYVPLFVPILPPSTASPVKNYPIMPPSTAAPVKNYSQPTGCTLQMEMAANLEMQARQAQLAAAAIRAQMGLQEHEVERAAAKGSEARKAGRPAKSKKVNLSQLESAATQDAPGCQTTLIVRNVPLEYTRDMLLEMLNDGGFASKFDFLYIPRDFQRACGLGYAFVNMTSHEEALNVQQVFNGFSEWKIPSHKICEVTWSEKHQGLVNQVKRYMNSPLMHESVPDDYKPMLFQNGARVDFPAPTMKLKRPRGLADPSSA